MNQKDIRVGMHVKKNHIVGDFVVSDIYGDDVQIENTANCSRQWVTTNQIRQDDFHHLICKNQCVSRRELRLDHCGEWKRYYFAMQRYLSRFIV